MVVSKKCVISKFLSLQIIKEKKLQIIKEKKYPSIFLLNFITYQHHQWECGKNKWEVNEH